MVQYCLKSQKPIFIGTRSILPSYATLTYSNLLDFFYYIFDLYSRIEEELDAVRIFSFFKKIILFYFIFYERVSVTVTVL